MKKLAFIGAGSHSGAVLPMVDHEGYRFVGFYDDKKIDEYDGYPVLGKIDEVFSALERKEIDAVFITIGENRKRQEIFYALGQEHYDKIVNIISSSATILNESSIKGRGIFIGHNSFIGAKVEIYDNTIINTGSIVEHHSVIDAHCNVAPNATINGLVLVGKGAYIGSGSVIKQQCKIQHDVIVGAGAVVVKDLVRIGMYVGVPAVFKKSVEVMVR